MVKDERKGQYWIMLALERFILESYSSELAEHVNTILNCFYDFDILEEEVILACYGSETVSKIFSSGKTYKPELSFKFKISATPFIDWLKHAEESEDEESLGGERREVPVNVLDIKIAGGTSLDDL